MHQQILDYLNSEEIETKVAAILDENFSAGQKENFLKVWQQMKDLKFDVKDWYNFLLFVFHNDIDKAEKVDDELFENVLIDVYDELQQLYEENKNKGNVEIEKEKSSQAAPQESDISQTELLRKYNIFIKSSLFQNILASQEMLMEKFMSVGAIHELPLQSNHDLPTQSIQNEFYQAINAGDKIKAVAVLRVLCAKGKLGSSFLNDKRYLDFWAGFLERHYGPDVKQKFLKNPIEKKYLLEFLRFILEKRLDFNLEESAMIGTGLAALCQESGEKEFEEMAFGDEEQGKFVWAE